MAAPSTTQAMEHVAREARTPRAIPIHPVLFALFPLLTLFAQNVGLTQPQELMRPAIACIAVVAIPWLALAGIYRSWARGAAFASVLGLLFFDFQHMRPLVKDAAYAIGLPWWRVEPHYVILWSIAAIGLAALPAARRFNTVKVTRGLNLFAAILVAIPLTQSIVNFNKNRPPSDLHAATLASVAPVKGTLPDVFFIVLDTYGRADSLKEYIHVDNSNFVRELQQRGFYVDHDARGNYNQTVLCLAASLNMDYVQDLLDPDDTGMEVRKRLDRNLVSDWFRSLGYVYVFVPTTHAPLSLNTADFTLTHNSSGLTAFEDALIGLTPVKPPTTGSASLPEEKRRRVLSAFRHLRKLARPGPKPRFVFAHIMLPHPPFVFGPDGSSREPIASTSLDGDAWMDLPNATPEGYRHGYREQLAYTNKLVLETIDALVGGSATPPIIIVQGDHGSKVTHNMKQVTADTVREALPILSAFRVPPEIEAGLYQGMSPVNNFRVILSRGFGQNLERIPDRSFYSPYGGLLRLTEVTDQVPASRSSPSPVFRPGEQPRSAGPPRTENK